MSDNDRNCSNEAVEKIIGNMTAEMQSQDGGQYVPLAYTPPPSEPLNWAQTPNVYLNNYNPYNPTPDIPMAYGSLDQFGQLNRQPPPFTYLQQPHAYNLNGYKNDLKYDIYETMQNGSQDNAIYPGSGDYLLGATLNHPNNERHVLGTPQHETPSHSTQRTHLIENLVGNWVPNTSGTYSPFGNVDPFKSNVGVFEKLPERESVIGQLLDEPGVMLPPEQSLEDKQFAFNRSQQQTRKPRMVAEVKPMRPSYSDVLTKPVPQTNAPKLTKNDGVKDATNKLKKDVKKTTKNDKGLKSGSVLNRSSTNNDIKDIPLEKNAFIKSSEGKNVKTGKGAQLNRKWASLDDINEPLGAAKVEESRKKKGDEPSSSNRSFQKTNFKKVTTNKTMSDTIELEMTGIKNEPASVIKNGLKKTNKVGGRQRTSENFGNGSNDRPPGKRNQRSRKRENHVLCGVVGQKLRQYLKGWWRIITVSLMWLLNLVSDIFSLSIHISRDMGGNLWLWLRIHWELFLEGTLTILKRIRMFTWLYEKFKKKEKPPEDPKQKSFLHSGLHNNINMPTTGEEAMKRLLACKGKDPYSILGVTPTCTDDDIKRYYKRQAFLVHPDKNQQPGAEEAFKILVHAFDMIGEPERRAAYDKGVVESVQVEQAWSELTELLAALQQKVEAAANTIRCSACGLRHKKVKVERPSYAARNCASCKIHHAAREGDIWAEAKCFGFLWHYYACMEGGVYDITEWAGCQKDSLKHLKPDSHQVQYRIALGKQSQPRRHSGSPRSEKPPDLENLLNTLYGQAEGAPGGAKRRSKNKAK